MNAGAIVRDLRTLSTWKRWPALAVLGLGLLVTATARAQIFNPTNGHYYQVVSVSGGVNWATANGAANALVLGPVPGHLATLTSLAESDFVFNNVTKSTVWIGGYQPAGSAEPAGGWQWVTGEAWDYTRWGGAEPNNALGVEDGLTITTSATWNDFNRSSLVGSYLVEYPTPGLLFHWKNPASGSFNAATSWSSDYLPKATESAIFDLASSGYTVSTNTDTTVSRLLVQNDQIVLDLSTGALSLQASNPVQAFRVADRTGDHGSLRLVGGSLSTPSLGVANTAGTGMTTGTLEIDGPTAIVNITANGPETQIGGSGNDVGELRIAHGGKLAAPATTVFLGRNGGSGKLVVADSGSSFVSSTLYAGLLGHGEIEITNTAEVTTGFLSVANQGSSPSGSVTIAGGGKLKAATADIGRAGLGTFALNSGSVQATTFYLGDSVTGDGRMTVTGSSSLNATSLYVGYSGRGQLDIGSGAVRTTNCYLGNTATGDGQVTVTGATSALESNLLVLGNGSNGQGRLSIAQGGIVATNLAIVGSVGVGSITMDGGFLQTATLTVGNAATAQGSVNMVANSAMYVAGTSTIGVAGQGSLTMSSGSQMASGPLRVGYGAAGNGQLIINSGATLTSTSPTFSGVVGGANATAKGFAEVQGGGSKWTNTGILEVGWIGQGNLSIKDGGSVTATSTQIGITATGVGEVLVSGAGARLDNSRGVSVGGNETTAGGSGLLNVTNGAVVTAGQQVHLWSGGTLKGNGSVIAAGGVLNDGLVAPGNSPGILNIDGDYAQSKTGKLQIEVGGLTPGLQHDKLLVTGAAAIAGLLEVPLVDVPGQPHYAPQLNDELTFLRAENGVAGRFDAFSAPGLENLPALPNGEKIAIKVFKDATEKEVHLKFVQRSDVFFTSPTDTDWEQSIGWSSMNVPDESTRVVVQNNAIGGDQRLEVQTDNAFADELVVGDPHAKITIGIHDLKSLSAAGGGVTISSNGVIELGVVESGQAPGAGTLAAPTVLVESGGLVKGNGRVIGDLVVGGANSTTAEAILSPGFSVGHVAVEGDYEQGTNGTLQIEFKGTNPNQVDTVAVSGEARLGGTLIFDASGLTTAGAKVPILTADALTGKFDSVSTINNNQLFVRPIYNLATNTLEGEGCDFGNMDCAGEIGDAADIEAFALALRDVDAYMERYQVYSIQAGDLDGWGTDHFQGNKRIDFDDIDDFVRLVEGHGTGNAAQLVLAAISSAWAVPEPAALGLVAAALAAYPIRRRRGIA